MNNIESNLVTVIIPCFNHGIYLKETIKNLCNQTHKNLKIIIVNDGSNDKFTIKLLQKLKKINYITVIDGKNIGPAGARNLGFTYVKTQYVLLIDADDMIEKTFVQKAVSVLETDSSIGVVSAWALCFGFEDYIWFPQGGTLKDFIYSTTCPSCALIRTKTWIDSGGFDTSFKVGYEDWDFWIRVTKSNWIIYIINEVLYYYLQKKHSRVTETFSKHSEIYNIIISKHPDVFKPIYPSLFDTSQDG